MSEQSIVKIGGSMIKRETEEKISLKSQFFDFLDIDLDNYKQVEYTKEEATYVKRRMQNLSTGAAAALPLICTGPKCPFQARCPFISIDKMRQEEWEKTKRQGLEQFGSPPVLSTPVGKNCLVELNLINEWTRIYINEFDVADNSFVELNMCRELAELEVMLWRINNGLAKEENADLMQEVITGVDREGNPLAHKEVHCFLDAREKLVNRKSRLIKLMVGDRQEKYKREAALKTREDRDPSTNAANLRGQITRLLKQAEAKALALAEAEGNVIDVPSGESTHSSSEILTPESLIDSEGKEE